jgi:dipeptidase D
MNRFLKDVVRNYEASLAGVQGGTLRNAIPRESFAIITIPEQLSDDLMDLVQEYEDLFNEEFAGIEQGITFEAEKTELPKSLIPSEIQDDLINAVEGCPNGVISMLADFPGVVESSLNLAIVNRRKVKSKSNCLFAVLPKVARNGFARRWRAFSCWPEPR